MSSKVFPTPKHSERFVCSLVPVFFALALSFSGQNAKAGLIGAHEFPDIVTSFGVMYHSPQNVLRLQGSSGIIRTPSNPNPGSNNLFLGQNPFLAPPSMPAIFMLQAEFNTSGVFQGGWFSVEGASSASATSTFSAADNAVRISPTPTLTHDPDVSLLSGTLTDLNAAVMGSGTRLQFTAGSLSGEFASIFGDEVVLTTNEFAGPMSLASLLTQFQLSGGSGSADIGRPVPEPSSALVWGSVIAIGCVRRRRNRRTLLTA